MCKYEKEIKAKNKQKREFSKLLTIWGMIFFAYVMFFASYATIVTKDMTAVPEMIIASSGLMATIAGFYFNKAKAENKIKLMKECDIKPDKDTFNNMSEV